ncbi:MAG: hypothetical protein KJP00_10800 [Bacteroidia bacterium]|nr:hypothetical protein [Bacteroidia bacterium]
MRFNLLFLFKSSVRMHPVSYFKTLLLLLLSLVAFHSYGQEEAEEEKKGFNIKLQLDSRQTFIEKKSVGIFGGRIGYPVNDKFEAGVGFYKSRLFNFLGRRVEIDYVDDSVSPPQLLPAEVGFKYVSIFGEYTFLENEKWVLTFNNQFGLGRVNIYVLEDEMERKVKENKTLVEHSVKAKFKALPWLYLIGGFGYRYLLSADEQIRKAFNPPIYIINAEIDFKELFGKKEKSEKQN